MIRWLRRLVGFRWFFVECPVCREPLRFWKGQVAVWVRGEKAGRWTCKSCHSDVTHLIAKHPFVLRARAALAKLPPAPPPPTKAPPRREVN